VAWHRDAHFVAMVGVVTAYGIMNGMRNGAMDKESV
jgi:hypothetical protein